jgi:hypothetical protein
MTPAEEPVQIDMNNVTVGDIQRLDNPALKTLMMQVKQQLEEEAAGAQDPLKCTSHSVHYLNFYNYTT